MRNLLRLVFKTCLLLSFAHAPQALAQNCSATVEDIDFGRAGLAQNYVDASAMLRVTCTTLPLVAVKLCPGLGAGTGGANGSARQLLGPSGAQLSYQLYQDAARTVPWGSVDAPELGTVPAIILPATLSGVTSASRTVYARLFGGQQSATAGTYVSAYAGASTAFSLSASLLGASGGCTGFVGTQVLRPEFVVRAAPTSACAITTTDLAFPPTGVLASSLLAQSSLNVTCTASTPYAVALDNGRNASDAGARRMAGPSGQFVTYQLFRDASRAQAWGAAAQAATGTGSGQAQVLTVYGRVDPQASPPPGTYTDRITVTVTY